MRKQSSRGYQKRISCTSHGEFFKNCILRRKKPEVVALDILKGVRLSQYFNGLVIREDIDEVPSSYVEALFEDAGWARNTPDWQKEKFSRIFKNST